MRVYAPPPRIEAPSRLQAHLKPLMKLYKPRALTRNFTVNHMLLGKFYNNNFADFYFRPGTPEYFVKFKTIFHPSIFLMKHVTCHYSFIMRSNHSMYSHLLNIPSSRRTTTGFKSMVPRNSHFPAWGIPTSNCFSLVTHRSVSPN